VSVEDTAPSRKVEMNTTPGPQPPEETSGKEHGTLKYSLLGPSLTKSGQENVDQTKVWLARVMKSLFNFIYIRSRKSSTMLRKAPNTSTTRSLGTRPLHRKSSAFSRRKSSLRSSILLMILERQMSESARSYLSTLLTRPGTLQNLNSLETYPRQSSTSIAMLSTLLWSSLTGQS